MASLLSRHAWDGFSAAGSESTRLGSPPKSRLRTGLPRRQICGARAGGEMDEIIQAEATKRDGQASRSPDLPSTDSSASAIIHSVSRPEGSAALMAEPRWANPNEQRPV